MPKAILEFNLPEDRHDHDYALAGLDCRIIIDNLVNEIRSADRYEGGVFAEVDVEEYDEAAGEFRKRREKGCVHTLLAVRNYLIEQLNDRRVPELV